MPSIFQGKLVRLRALEPEDWETFFVWDQQDTEHNRFQGEIGFPASSLRARTWAENASRDGGNGDEFIFQIETLEGILAGTINTHHCDFRNGTFMYGIAVLPPHQRKGYASEAICLVLRYFFEERRYQKCSTGVFSFNAPSQRLHERLGFLLEGRLRRILYSEGAYHDELQYGITREEFSDRWKTEAEKW